METENNPSPATISHRSAFTSAAWLIIGFGGLQILRLGSNIVLARLLLPEAFGLMALVNILNQGLHMLSDAGIWMCVIRSKRGDDKVFLQTAWTVQVIRGFFLSAMAVAIAWPAAWLYREPELGPLLAVTGLTSVLASFRSVASFTQNRKMAVGRLVMIEIVSYALSMLVAIAWVWHTPTVWALVAATLIACSLQVILSHWLLPSFVHGFRWEPSAVKEISQFGRWIFISTFCTFLAGQADRLLMGFLDSVATLGIYHIAAMFAAMPVFLMGCLSNQVLLPYYSRLNERGKTARVREIHFLACLFAWAMTAGVQMLGPTLIHLLYRGPYEQAGIMLAILGYGTWFALLQAIGGAMILAQGRSQSAAFINFAKLLMLGLLLPVAIWMGTLQSLLWTFVLAELVRYLLTLRSLGSFGVQAGLQDLGLTALLLLTTWTGTVLIDIDAPLLRSSFQIGLVVVVTAILVAFRKHLAESDGKVRFGLAWTTPTGNS